MAFIVTHVMTDCNDLKTKCLKTTNIFYEIATNEDYEMKK